ncbi:hypothetical protein ZIOFF_074527 (mitochondrion) [Zingiber officinale]|uniref:Uncharacterized protein n=1 Tax=Zingiber officinale TaxID=94328 RepID=A0A8J5ET44_ZINOF|nr:hypothetical protein ZIOFF_075474 [Zingiber officinale]KAG6467622.1 hypothetical protein ZIOFF_074519 [Zingiber officinale]KAG6467630.1 hypothetical protein ZIOFF_074527 [Zingiber officinale]
MKDVAYGMRWKPLPGSRNNKPCTCLILKESRRGHVTYRGRKGLRKESPQNPGRRKALPPPTSPLWSYQTKRRRKFPDIIKKVRREFPLKQKALNYFHDVAEMITVKHKIQSWNLPTLVSWGRASYLVDSPFPPPRALAFRVDTQEIHYMKIDMTQSPEEYDVPDLASLDSPSTSRRGGSISISIPEMTFSSIFSETGEFLLYLQECYLGIKESWNGAFSLAEMVGTSPPDLKTAIYHTWKERNARIFKQSYKAARELFYQICAERKGRISASKLKYSNSTRDQQILASLIYDHPICVDIDLKRAGEAKGLDESPQKGQSTTSLPIIKASPSPCKKARWICPNSKPVVAPAVYLIDLISIFDIKKKFARQAALCTQAWMMNAIER